MGKGNEENNKAQLSMENCIREWKLAIVNKVLSLMKTSNENIDGKYTYFAFIAYAHDDYGEAYKLYKKFQIFGLPVKLRKKQGAVKRLIPMFLDNYDMRTGEYKKVDGEALEKSKFLIVVCSHKLHSHDDNVNEEIEKFLEFGRSPEDILPYIIDYDKEPEKNCFPSKLINMREEENINLRGESIYNPRGKKEKRRAKLKLLAQMHGISSAELENEDDRRRRRNTIKVIIAMFLAVLIALSIYAYVIFTKFPCKIDMKERYAGTKDWYTEEMYAEVGDTVEFQIGIVNDRGFLTNSLAKFAENNNIMIKSDNLMVRVVLPDNLEYIEDSTVLYNSNYQSGVRVIENTLVTSGINIGSYVLKGNAYIRFSCRVVRHRTDDTPPVWSSVTIWPPDGTSAEGDSAILVKDSILIRVSQEDERRTHTIAGWGDSANGRPSYVASEIESGVLGNNIVFNSISDSQIGDEKNFVAAKPVGSQQSWKSEVIHVTDGGIYGIRLYLHNDNPLGEAVTAEDVKVSFSLPTEVHKVQGVTGYISCSNAEPNRYWDGVTFYSTKEFYIEYLSGSAKFINVLGAFDLSDDIITEGVTLGYSELDGKIPGGYEYDGQVTIDVIVRMK